MTDADDILFDVRNGVGFITLNRPQVLNALTFRMTLMLSARLAAWARDPGIRAVAIMGAGDRAFCSGGDVKSVAAEAREGGGVLCSDFFREEYVLNYRIHTYPKPYIAFVNGIVMGGGKGLSAHGSHRVVSEKVTFAMPETGIGFFPDVGGGYFLPRCPGETGTYLALTGARIGAADCMYIGFGTHFVESKDFPALVEALSSPSPGACRERVGERAVTSPSAAFLPREENVECGTSPHPNPLPACAGRGDIDAFLAPFSKPAPGDSTLARHRAAIDRCFAFDRVEDIMAALAGEGTDFSRETLKALSALSPTSLKVALRQLRLGAQMDFAAVMTMEYRLSQRLVLAPDFYEGVRAALIDRDKTPRWTPATLAAVDEAVVEGYFQSLGAHDLVF